MTYMLLRFRPCSSSSLSQGNGGGEVDLPGGGVSGPGTLDGCNGTNPYLIVCQCGAAGRAGSKGPGFETRHLVLPLGKEIKSLLGGPVRW